MAEMLQALLPLVCDRLDQLDEDITQTVLPEVIECLHGNDVVFAGWAAKEKLQK